MRRYIDVDGRTHYEDCLEPYDSSLRILRWMLRGDLYMLTHKPGQFQSWRRPKVAWDILRHLLMYARTLWSGRSQVIWRRIG